MAEDTTQDMPDARSFEERVFARFDSLDARSTALEERVERRMQETRPIWEAMQSQLDRLENKFDRLNEKLDLITSDLYEMRANIKSLSRRVTSIEDRQPQ